MAAKITVYISSTPDAATFAQRLRQAIVDHGGTVVSTPPPAVPATPAAPAAAATEPAALGERELTELQGAQAFVAVLTPTAIQSPALQAAAQLSPTIHEATGLFLLAPQSQSGGGMVTSGFGPGGRRGFHGPPPPPPSN